MKAFLLVAFLALGADAFRHSQSGYVPQSMTDPIRFMKEHIKELVISYGIELPDNIDLDVSKPTGRPDFEKPDLDLDGSNVPTGKPNVPTGLPTLPPKPTLPYNLTVDKVKEIIGRVKSKMSMCWKDSYGRGVGKPVHACSDPKYPDKDAGLCYKDCKSGYKGVATVCWEKCKSGYTDTGAFCTRPAKIISSDNSKCPWYDICGLTFEKGCSKCPDHDPKYKNDGCTCRIDVHTYAKDTYDRGVGKPLKCSDNEDYDAGLCYPKCKSGYKGVGPVCWEKCPSSRPHDSGAVCCTDKQACKDFIGDVTKACINLVATAVEMGFNQADVEDFIKAIIQVVVDFSLLKCTRFP